MNPTRDDATGLRTTYCCNTFHSCTKVRFLVQVALDEFLTEKNVSIISLDLKRCIQSFLSIPAKLNL